MRKGKIRIGIGCALAFLQVLSDMGNAKAGYVYSISFDNPGIFAYDVIVFVSSHIIGILGAILLTSGLISLFKSRKVYSESSTPDEHWHNVHPVELSLSGEPKQDRGRKRERLLIVAIIVLIALNVFQFVSNCIVVSKLQSIIYSLQAPQISETAEPESIETSSIPEPYTGYVFREIKVDLTSPLTMEAEGEHGFLVILTPIELTGTYNGNAPETNYEAWKQMNSEKDSCIKIYIRGNDSHKFKVPPGKYELYYATGESWQGLSDLFGPKTTYYKYEGTFTFDDTAAGYSAIIIPLITSDITESGIIEINSSDFPK